VAFDDRTAVKPEAGFDWNLRCIPFGTVSVLAIVNMRLFIGATVPN
jgi:hypothetical protein